MPNKKLYAITALLTLATTCCCLGCVSQYAMRVTDVRRDFYDVGDPNRAREEIERREKRAPSNEQSVWKLNRASLALSTGDFREAKANLIAVRDEFDAIEENRARRAGENLLQYWTDENAKSYEGEDYEKVMARATLAIAELMDGGGDARAYAHQIAAKQDEIVMRGQLERPKTGKGETLKNPKLAYPRVPLGPYLEGLIWEETFVDSSEAARCYEKVAQWRPQFKQGVRDLKRAMESVHSQPGSGRLYVFAFVGRGPYKRQGNAEVTQTALLIADQVFSAVNEYSVPPTVAPVPIPELVITEPRAREVDVKINGESVGATETLADVNEMAIKQFEATKDQIIARAVIRRIVKKGTVYAAKEAAAPNDWVSLAMDLGGVVWEATETADTRCWGLLPAKIQAWSCELPAGRYVVECAPLDSAGRSFGVSRRAEIEIAPNQNTYALVSYDDTEPLGEILVSR